MPGARGAWCRASAWCRHQDSPDTGITHQALTRHTPRSPRAPGSSSGTDVTSSRAGPDRHGHHQERSTEPRRGPRVGRLGRRDRRRRFGSTDETAAIAERYSAARRGARIGRATASRRNHAASLASHDWILSLDADERVSPALGEEIRALLRLEPPARGYRIPRVTFHLGRWIRTHRLVSRLPASLYDRARAAGPNGSCTNPCSLMAGPDTCRRAAALPLPRSGRSPGNDRPLHDAGGRADAPGRRRPAVVSRHRASAARVPAELHPERGLLDGTAGLKISAAELVLRLPEIREGQSNRQP